MGAKDRRGLAGGGWATLDRSENVRLGDTEDRVNRLRGDLDGVCFKGPQESVFQE